MNPRRVTTTEDRMVGWILWGIAVFAVAVVAGTFAGIWWAVAHE